MALVSVIIPVYNGEETIRETIESVLDQTCSDFELLIINDGSSDQTLDVVSHLIAATHDSRIQLFSYPNSGVNASRNRGIQHSIGEFIAFLDADDLWTTDKLETQLMALQTHPDAAVAYSWVDYIDADGNFLRRGSYCDFSGNVYAQLLLSDFLENGSNPLIRRSHLMQVGLFDESLSYGEDWELWIRLAARYPFIAVGRSQILYRVSFHTASTHTTKMEAQVLQVIEKSFAQAPDSLQYLKRISISNLYKYLICKTLENVSERNQGLIALKFLWLSIYNDPHLLKAKVLLKVLVRIAITLGLPAKASPPLLNRFKKSLNIDALLGYVRLDP
jgi:glycosyltransferase involved in cell wall biosynthesis